MKASSSPKPRSANIKDLDKMLLETDVIAKSESTASSESEGEINRALEKRVSDR